MIPGRHRVLGLFAIMGALVGGAVGDVRAQASGPNAWTMVAPLPEGLLWPAVASAAGKLYVFGGLCSFRGRLCQTFEAYDPQANRWTSMGTLPERLVGLSSATTGPNGLIYLYGLPGAGGKAVMLVYHPRANTWSHASTPPPASSKQPSWSRDEMGGSTRSAARSAPSRPTTCTLAPGPAWHRIRRLGHSLG